MSYTIATQWILHTKGALNWTTPWPGQKDPFSKFIIREIQKFPYWKLTFFLDKLYQKFFFFLCSTFTVTTVYWVWFNLDNSLTRWKRPIFKFRYPKNSKISVLSTNYFPRRAIPKIPFSFALPTQLLLHTEFSLISTTPWPDQNYLFLKVVICKILKFLQLSVWNANFFPSQAIPKIRFVWRSSNTGDTPCQVCFDLHISLTRWKRPIFKICYSRNSKISVLNTNIFPRQAIPKIPFFSMLYLHSGYWIPSMVRFWQILDLIKMTYFQKSLFAKFANFLKFPYDIPTFFLAKQYKNSFSSDTLATQVILHTYLASICTIPWHDEKDLFFENSLIAKIKNFRMK